jgi:hypothetical protein
LHDEGIRSQLLGGRHPPRITRKRALSMRSRVIRYDFARQRFARSAGRVPRADFFREVDTAFPALVK